MSTATVCRRPFLPGLPLLLAGGAAVLGVIVIAADDAGSITPSGTRAGRRSGRQRAER